MRITRFGWAVFGVLAACVVVALVAGPTARFIALAIGGVLFLALVGEGVAGWGDDPWRKQEVLEARAEIERAGARDRQQSSGPL